MGRGRVLGGGASSGVDHNLSQGPCRVIAPAGEISGLSCFPGFRLDHTGPNSLSWPGTEGQHPQVKGKRASVPAPPCTPILPPFFPASTPRPLLFRPERRRGRGLYVYVCMHVRVCARTGLCMCSRVSKRMCAGAGGEVHVLTQVFGVVSLLSGRRRHVVVLFVCACL